MLRNILRYPFPIRLHTTPARKYRAFPIAVVGVCSPKKNTYFWGSPLFLPVALSKKHWCQTWGPCPFVPPDNLWPDFGQNPPLITPPPIYPCSPLIRNHTSESCLCSPYVRRERLTHSHLENNVTQLRIHRFLYPSPKIYLQGKSESELCPVILDSLKVSSSWPRDYQLHYT